MSGVKVKKFKILFMLMMMMVMIFPGTSQAVERLAESLNGYTLYGAQRYSGVVMAAYQKAYAMNFEIWKPQDLP
ncbi:MAG: hypothetical protein IJU31_05550, partial [Synergistaceae bacterium]|nr:hypothetical protein [Synergistaceae bacterium]